jgi:PAS domain S-box-containing protein
MMKSFLQWFLRWGIRRKLFVLVVSTTVLTAGAVSILDYMNISQKLIETTGEKLSVISENASELIVRQIHNEINLIRFMATSDTIQTAVEQANLINLADTSVEIEQTVTQADQNWLQKKPESLELINRIMDQPVSLYLRNMQTIYNEEVEVFVTDANGLVIGMTNPTTDYLQSDESWWTSARDHGIYIGNPAFDESSGRWGIILAISLSQPKTNRFSGVLRGTVDVTSIFDAILHTNVGKSGYGIFISKDKLVYGLRGDQLVRNPVTDAFSNMIRSTGTRWVNNILDVNGVISLMAVHPVSDGEYSIGWVAVLISEAEIRDLLLIALRQNITVAVMLIIIFGSLAILFANNILGGLRLLEEEVLQLEKGNYAYDFSKKMQSSQEMDIRNLVQTFDQMKRVISERENQLQESDSKHRLLVETMNEGLAMMDAEYKIQYMNPQLSDWTGYSLQTIYNHNYLDIFPESEHEKIKNQTPKRMTGVHSPYESLLRTRDHGYMPVLISPKPITDSRGNFLGSLVVITDNSENKKIEAGLKKRIAELASLQQIDHAILDGTSMQNIVDAVFLQLKNQLRVHVAYIYIYDPSTLEVQLARYFNGERQNQCNPESIQMDRLVADYEKNRSGYLRMITKEQIIDTEIQLSEYGIMYSKPIYGIRNLSGVIQIGFDYSTELTEEWYGYFEILMSQAALGFDKIQLLDHLRLRNIELEEAYDSAIKGWANALELRDKETKGHSDRVVKLADEIARRMGFSGPELEKIRIGSLMHDIGKMGVPDHILLKPGPLDDEEWVIMKKHPVYAYQMLGEISYLKEAVDIPHYHHEHWDGSGYPEHLKGEEIPLPARIFAIVDVWDALTSDRPYRKAWSVTKTIDYLRQNRGVQFDPQVADIFLEYLEQNPEPSEPV